MNDIENEVAEPMILDPETDFEGHGEVPKTIMVPKHKRLRVATSLPDATARGEPITYTLEKNGQTPDTKADIDANAPVTREDLNKALASIEDLKIEIKTLQKPAVTASQAKITTLPAAYVLDLLLRPGIDPISMSHIHSVWLVKEYKNGHDQKCAVIIGSLNALLNFASVCGTD
jgi:hypothetical protein